MCHRYAMTTVSGEPQNRLSVTVAPASQGGQLHKISCAYAPSKSLHEGFTQHTVCGRLVYSTKSSICIEQSRGVHSTLPHHHSTWKSSSNRILPNPAEEPAEKAFDTSCYTLRQRLVNLHTVLCTASPSSLEFLSQLPAS